MDYRIIYGIAFGAGILFGGWLYQIFLIPKTETVIEYKETIKTDTVYLTLRDTVYLKKVNLKQTFIRDTVFIKPYEPKINQFKATYPLLYGNVYLEGEVLGEVLKTSIMTDFKIPSVTNTITKETKTVKIKKPTGLYAVGGLHSDLKLYYGATYVRDRVMIGYKIRLDKQIHSLEVGYKVF